MKSASENPPASAARVLLMFRWGPKPAPAGTQMSMAIEGGGTWPPAADGWGRRRGRTGAPTSENLLNSPTQEKPALLVASEGSRDERSAVRRLQGAPGEIREIHLA
eukprot:6959598-Pyramimonas_sp.AAC.1